MKIKLFLVLLFFNCSWGQEIQPSSSNCDGSLANGNSTGGLQDFLSNITSDTVLRLAPGCHHLTVFTPVIDKFNITLVGNDTDSTVITCDKGIGLVFVNISQVKLQHLVIMGCSLNGSHLNETVDDILSFVPEFAIFTVGHNQQIGVVIAHATDVSLEEISVNDTSGIGLLAVNVLGMFTIDSSVFAGNHPRRYELNDHTLIDEMAGGGLLVFYHNTGGGGESDSYLSVTRSHFLLNSHFGLSGSTEVYFFYYEQVSRYNIGAGGGLSLFLAQRDYSVNITVDNCTFCNNSATRGGAMFAGVFVGVQNSSLTVADSEFHSNGIASPNTDRFNTTFGQGISLVTDLIFPSVVRSVVPSNMNVFTIVDTRFLNNKAIGGSAVELYSRYAVISPDLQPYRLIIKNCSFQHNMAFYGGAVILTENKYSGVQTGTLVSIDNCSFHQNQLLTPEFSFSSTSAQSSSIIEAKAINVTFSGTTVFSNNSGTPIHGTATIIHVYGEMCISNNTGLYGGGMSLTTGTLLILHANSTTTFYQNTAFGNGGAISSSFQGTESAVNYFDCFLFFESPDLLRGFSGVPSLNVKVRFLMNDAPYGTAVYGSTLRTCPWANELRYGNASNVFIQLQNANIFEFSPKIDDSTFSTAAYRLKVNDSNANGVLMPGEELNVDVLAIDRFEQESASLIYSNVLDNIIDGRLRSYISASNYWLLHRNFTQTPVSVRSRNDLTGEKNIQVGLFSFQSTAQALVNITVGDCYPGFEFDESSTSMYKSCVCNAELIRNHPTIQCFPGTAQFTVPDNVWLGPINKGGRNITAHVCVFNYCKFGYKNVTARDFSSQCKDGSNREGLLCGQCQDNYSIAFGTNSCLKCSNWSIFFLLYFIVSGLTVISTISRIGVTVSHGFLNSLIFYSNIIIPFEVYLIPRFSSAGVTVLLYTFSVINLNVGFPACFYDGMDTLSRTYLNFVFPFYLWILMGVYTYLARFEKFRKHWLKENAAAVFASVMLLSYTSTLQACTLALSVVRIDNAQYSWRWAPDPTVIYFSRQHAPLGVLSIFIILVYIIPAPILTMFPSLTLKTRLFNRFIPIYDALWAPFRNYFQFWIGLRLFLRVIPFILANFASYPLNVFLLGIFIVLLLFGHVLVKPYKGHAQNLLDVYLLLNILLLVMSSLFVDTQTDIDSVQNGYQFLTYGILILAQLAVILVYCYHLYYAYEFIRKYSKRFLTWLNETFNPKKKEQDVIVSKEDEEDTVLPAVVNYSELREPLLESGQVSLKYFDP